MEILFQSIVGSALTSGIIIWLSKSWISERLKNAIKHEYDEKLETLKIQLNAQNSIELEKIKSKLYENSIEHQIKFSKLHDIRAEVIAETYSLLYDLYYAIAKYTTKIESGQTESRKRRFELAHEAFDIFYKYYQKKVIYLPKETVSNIRILDTKLTESFYDFWIIVDGKEEDDDEAMKTWQEIYKNINGEIKNTLSQLEDEFRTLLGEKANKM